MALSVEEKAQIVAEYQQAAGDTGSPEVQVALLTANILRLDRQLVLRSLYENDLEEIIQDFGYTEKQAKEAIHQAKEQLKVAKKTWEQRS